MAKLEREILVCYDVSATRARSHLHDALKGLGLVPVQASVFWGFLREAEIREARRLLEEHLDTTTDRGFIVPVAMALSQRVGYVEPAFEPPPRSCVV